jgi:hypothetical protein
LHSALRFIGYANKLPKLAGLGDLHWSIQCRPTRCPAESVQMLCIMEPGTGPSTILAHPVVTGELSLTYYRLHTTKISGCNSRFKAHIVLTPGDTIYGAQVSVMLTCQTRWVSLTDISHMLRECIRCLSPSIAPGRLFAEKLGHFCQC